MVLDVNEGLVLPGEPSQGNDGVPEPRPFIVTGSASLVLVAACATGHHQAIQGVPSHQVTGQAGMARPAQVVGGLGMDDMGEVEGPGHDGIRVDA
jgi:hypothetical protein